VLRHVIASITPASYAHGEEARRRVARAHASFLEHFACVTDGRNRFARVARAHASCLEHLARALGGAQHTARPRGDRRTIVVCAGDHGVGDPGIALGAAHPTVVAAHAIAAGSTALAQIARAGHTSFVLVDAGAREPQEMPASAVRLGRAPSRDLMAGPAMTVVDATLALEAGIALAVSLADDGLDVLAVGALGVGAEVASAALLGAALGAPPTGLADPVAEAAGAKGAALTGASAIELLAAFGGPETGVLAGLLLAAASINVPVILDGHATGAAALVAAALAPHVTGYLVAAHIGIFTHTRILAHLGLHPMYEVGLGHGEGTGAAMLLPLIDQVTALASRG
jgi:nicotinate-nucleotide--dimethylbenzimidazole phosphoribosyltransferase